MFQFDLSGSGLEATSPIIGRTREFISGGETLLIENSPPRRPAVNHHQSAPQWATAFTVSDVPKGRYSDGSLVVRKGKINPKRREVTPSPDGRETPRKREVALSPEGRVPRKKREVALSPEGEDRRGKEEDRREKVPKKVDDRKVDNKKGEAIHSPEGEDRRGKEEDRRGKEEGKKEVKKREVAHSPEERKVKKKCHHIEERERERKKKEEEEARVLEEKRREEERKREEDRRGKEEERRRKEEEGKKENVVHSANKIRFPKVTTPVVIVPPKAKPSVQEDVEVIRIATTLEPRRTVPKVVTPIIAPPVIPDPPADVPDVPVVIPDPPVVTLITPITPLSDSRPIITPIPACMVPPVIGCGQLRPVVKISPIVRVTNGSLISLHTQGPITLSVGRLLSFPIIVVPSAIYNVRDIPGSIEILSDGVYNIVLDFRVSRIIGKGELRVQTVERPTSESKWQSLSMVSFTKEGHIHSSMVVHFEAKTRVKIEQTGHGDITVEGGAKMSIQKVR